LELELNSTENQQLQKIIGGPGYLHLHPYEGQENRVSNHLWH